jgi:hypothetical protein
MESLEFLTEEEKNAMSVNDLAVYLDILKLLEKELEKLQN